MAARGDSLRLLTLLVAARHCAVRERRHFDGGLSGRPSERPGRDAMVGADAADTAKRKERLDLLGGIGLGKGPGLPCTDGLVLNRGVCQ